MFDQFLGNAPIVAAVRQMIADERLPQTMLFAGPEGVGKATLARLIAAAFNCKRGGPDPCGECSSCRRILQADLSRPEYQALLEERAKMPPERRRDVPLIVSTHPEFLIFPPDGPLAQISIEQVRALKEHARFGPSQGRHRLFLLDHADRTDTPAANSLLKILEEPPPYLTVILTTENAYDLLPTIRSRSVPFFLAPLSPAEMERFLAARTEITPEHRSKLKAWAQGRPGGALAIDVPVYEGRRQAMFAALQTAAQSATFAQLVRHTEALGRMRQEKLELQLDMLYGLLHDLMHLQQGAGAESLINADMQAELAALAARIDFEWLERALADVDALDALARRNIQKQIALEAFAVGLRQVGAPTLA